MASVSDPNLINESDEDLPLLDGETGGAVETLVDSASLDAPASDDLTESDAVGAREPELSERQQWAAARREMTAGGVDWPVTIWLAVLHVGVLAAPFTFTWTGLAVAVGLYWLTGSIGICLGFHRMLTHRSFRTHRVTRWIIACIGQLAGEGSALHWVANHRKHHAHSDQVGDPHSPHNGNWWSHMLWLLWHMPPQQQAAYHRRWVPDLVEDRVLQALDRTFIFWHLGLGTLLFAIGWQFGGAQLACSLLVWGMFVRLVYLLHATWLVNSASHIWGYRTYETSDDSRNNWWVALLTFGEGWHNNHHAFPSMARAGHRWWEIDITFWVIRLMSACGLAWDVVDGHHLRNTDKRKVADS